MKLAVMLNAGGVRQEAGRLEEVGRAGIRFQYAPSFLATGRELSPLACPATPGVWTGYPRVNDGLPAFIAESLPGAWGRQLARGLHPESESPLQRLARIGRGGMGALEFEPAEGAPAPEEEADLDAVADEVTAVLEGRASVALRQWLEAASGFAGGARPKMACLVADDESGRIRCGTEAKPGWSPWLVKFPGQGDDENQGVQEFLCAELMREAGIDVPPVRLFASRRGPGWFGSRRFDRTAAGKVFMTSAAGLLGLNPTEDAFDYVMLLALAKRLTGAEGVAALWKRCVFNHLVGNRDDHAKNFAFLLTDEGRWRVSPAYDVVPSSRRGEHAAVMPCRGREPVRQDFMDLADRFDIPVRNAEAALAAVCEAVAQYPERARAMGVKVPDGVRFELPER